MGVCTHSHTPKSETFHAYSHRTPDLHGGARTDSRSLHRLARNHTLDTPGAGGLRHPGGSGPGAAERAVGEQSRPGRAGGGGEPGAGGGRRVFSTEGMDDQVAICSSSCNSSYRGGIIVLLYLIDKEM